MFARQVLSSTNRSALLAAVSLAAAATAAAAAVDGSSFSLGPQQPNSSRKPAALAAASAVGAAREVKSHPHDLKHYQEIYNAIATKLQNEDDHDDGSYGPVLVRLAWHDNGSYDQNDHSKCQGGSFPGTMRFPKEQKDPGNAGLGVGIQFLEEFKKKFDISYADLYTLGGVVAVQEMGGPKIGWRAGREDLDEQNIPPYGRLPDATQETGSYLREVFTDRLGFDDRELTVLIGVGHGIGRCHVQHSGFEGPWTFSPTMITNAFFQLLLSEDWREKKWDGNRQYEDEGSHSLMMLPSDMALKKDSKLLKYVEEYAKDEEKCMKDFAVAFAKLLERGCKFNTEQMFFKTLDEQ